MVVLGAGFGGLRVVRRMAGKPVRLTLVDRSNYHLFQPLLYQVATAGVSPNEIAYPVRATLRRQENAEFLLADVQDIDLNNHYIKTDRGDLAYDYLVLAVGGRSNYFGLDSVEAEWLWFKNA